MEKQEQTVCFVRSNGFGEAQGERNGIQCGTLARRLPLAGHRRFWSTKTAAVKQQMRSDRANPEISDTDPAPFRPEIPPKMILCDY